MLKRKLEILKLQDAIATKERKLEILQLQEVIATNEAEAKSRSSNQSATKKDESQTIPSSMTAMTLTGPNLPHSYRDATEAVSARKLVPLLPKQKGKRVNIPEDSQKSKLSQKGKAIREPTAPKLVLRGQPTAATTKDFQPTAEVKTASVDQFGISRKQVQSDWSSNPRKRKAQWDAKLEGKPFNMLDQLQLLEPRPIELAPQKPKSKNERKTLNTKNLTRWRVSGHGRLSTEQYNVLNDLFNHVRQGTGNPVPVREAEIQFKHLNSLCEQFGREKKLIGDYSLDPIPFHAERDTTAIDEEAPLKAEYFQKICPLYFMEEIKWSNLFTSLSSTSWQFILTTFFKMNKVDVDEIIAKVQIVYHEPLGHLIEVYAPIPANIFADLFEAGFIRSYILSEESNKMLSQLPDCIQKFDRYLWVLRFLRSGEINIVNKYGVKITSAPPLFVGEHWKNLKDFQERKPVKFPAIHILQEWRDCDDLNQPPKDRILFLGSQPSNSNHQQRAKGLAMVKKLATKHKGFSTWKDCQRILLLEEAKHTRRNYLAKQFAKGKSPLVKQMVLATMAEAADEAYESSEEQDIINDAKDIVDTQSPNDKGKAVLVEE